MTNLQNVVLHKFKPAFDRERMTPGRRRFNFEVSLSGVLLVEPDQKVTPTAELPLYGVLVTALLESGVEPEKVLRVIERIAWRAFERREKFNQQLAQQAEELVESVRQRFAEKLPKVKRAGAIKLDAVVARL